MVGAAGKNAASSIPAEQKKLDSDFFPSVLNRKALPPGESSDAEQFLAIKKDIRASHPGHFIANHLAIGRQVLFQMQGIRRIIDQVALPGNRLAVKWLRYYRPHPEIDVLLVGAPFIEIVESSRSTADKSTVLCLDHQKHPLHDFGLKQYIVIQKVDIGSVTLLQQKVPVFSHAPSMRVTQ